jgi:four helix bundle protein
VAFAQRFEELEAWKTARELSKAVYDATRDGAWARDYGLRDQIRRASVSVLSNIAEGFERRGVLEFGRFLTMAKGSAGEIRCQLYIALDQGYIDQNRFDEVRALAETTSGKIAGLVNHLKGRSRPDNNDQ